MSFGSQIEGQVAEQERLARLFDEVAKGLGARPKRIPEKLFYDDRGARLFEEITRLEEYYPTRIEMSILGRCLEEVGHLVGPRARVVEFGSGSGRKTNLLLDSLDHPAAYVPVDISEAQLLRFSDRLRMEYPNLSVTPVIADYTRPYSLTRSIGQGEETVGRTLFFFPGSSIGNFEPGAAEDFLARIGSVGGSGSALLIGVDLVKERNVLEAAYDDSQGVTAEFNRNALRYLNGLFDGDFDLSSFEHRALWNEKCSRIEMRLVSTEDQRVTLRPGLPRTEPLTVRFRKGEEVVTEHSYKYTIEGFESLCANGGWAAVRRWTDDRGWFSVHFFEREE